MIITYSSISLFDDKVLSIFFKFWKAYFVEKLAAVESFVLADVRAELLAALLVVEGGVLQV